MNCSYVDLPSIGWIARELQVRQSHAVDQYLVRADRCGCCEVLTASVRDVIVLIDAVAAHAQSAYQHAILVEGQAPGKEYNAILVGIGSLRALRAGMCQVSRKQTEKRPSIGAVDAGREQGLCREPDRAVRNGGATGNSRQVCGACGTAEVDCVSSLSNRHVNAEDSRVGHPVQA